MRKWVQMALENRNYDFRKISKFSCERLRHFLLCPGMLADKSSLQRRQIHMWCWSVALARDLCKGIRVQMALENNDNNFYKNLKSIL